jgi:ribulose-phosphate 3-epimerase
MSEIRKRVQISPSLAAGNLLNLSREIELLEAADSIHFDVMDGHFVPLLTLGVPILEQVRKITKKILDVHIMVSNPDATFQYYLDAGADVLTFHPEVALHSHRICQTIRKFGKKSGVALNPGTHPQSIEYLFPVVDQITIMSVNPGYSRQAHIPQMIEKVKYVREQLDARGFTSTLVQVDGGVNASNIQSLFEAGANIFVAGGAVFNETNYSRAIEALKCFHQ